MVREPIDAEQIGMLLDGTAGQERDELLVRLSAAEDDYEVFADTAAVLRELEDEAEAAVPQAAAAPALAPAEEATAPPEAPTPEADDVIPLRPRQGGVWTGPAVRWLAAAAVLATVAVPVIRSRGGADAWRNPRNTATLSLADAGLPADVDTMRPWPIPRGGDRFGEPLKGSSARVGTLHTDLEIAANARGERNVASVRALAGGAARTVRLINLAGLEHVALQYERVDTAAAAPRARLLSALSTASTAAAEYLDSDYFELGAWTESARLAAKRKNTDFFSSKGTRRALERAAGLEGLSDQGKAAARAATSLVEQAGGIRDWGALSVHLKDLHRELVTTLDPDPLSTD